jgi:5-methylthioribose kinase
MDNAGAQSVNIESSSELADYLCLSGRAVSRDCVFSRVLSGGVSNRTVLVHLSGGERWVMKQALGKLRVAVDWFSSPERIHREAEGMRWLAGLAPEGTVPRLIFEDKEQHLLAMEAVPEPCDTWKSLLLSGRIESDHVRQFATLLGTIHGRAAIRADELAEIFEDTQFFESLRIEPYYTYTAERQPEASVFLRRLIEDTRRNRWTLVHGDFSPKNILLADNRLVLIDHEVIHFGDPGFDLGFGLTHLLSKYHHLSGHRERMLPALCEFWPQYRLSLQQAASEKMLWLQGLESRAVRHTLGCLLARVRGRSPLEYLSEAERHFQTRAVLQLMATPPETVVELIDRWVDTFRDPSES